MKCEICRKEWTLQKTRNYKYVEAGLENVFLENIKVYSCADCAIQVPILPKVLALHDAIAEAIIMKPDFLSGDEIRFLRKNLRVKAVEWAELLRTKKETLSRWENDERAIGAQSDLLIRYLAARLFEERKGRRINGEIARRLANIERGVEPQAIFIDVENIEKVSYHTLTEDDKKAVAASESALSVC